MPQTPGSDRDTHLAEFRARGRAWDRVRRAGWPARTWSVRQAYRVLMRFYAVKLKVLCAWVDWPLAAW